MDESLYYAGVALAVWFVLAYLALPTLWRRAERQKVLAAFEMVTRTRQGIAGDPINFGLVGDEAEVLWAFHAAGWTLGGWMLARAAAADERYAPLVSFYLARLLPKAAGRVAEIEAADSLLALLPAA